MTPLSKILCGVLAVILWGTVAASAWAQYPEQEQQAKPQPKPEKKPEAPKPEQKAQPSKGTGVVPPGVKLTPEMPSAAPPKSFEFPPVSSRELPNGLRVFVVSDHREPAVTVRFVLTSAGTIYDPDGRAGVAVMTANLLTKGTEKRTAQQIAESIDFVGGSLAANADSEGTYITVTVPKKDLNLAMDLLSDITLHATFRPEELERRREQTLSELRLNYSDANFLATMAFGRIVYGRSPYGLPDDGTPESVAKLTRNDLVRFRGTNYASNQALLAFAGDIAPDEAFAATEKYLGGWANKQPKPPLPAAPPQPTPGLRIYVIDKPDAVQTQIRVGRLGIRRNSPDYIPLYVTNRIFGGGYNSRLNTEVRVRKGLTYGARSEFDSHRFAGHFVAQTFTRTEATVEATRLVIDLMGKMADGSVTPEELNFARDYLTGVYPIQTETAEQVAGRVLTVAHFDLPADYNQTYQRRVMAVGLDQVRAVAERYFDTDSLDLVLVGNASQFRSALKKAFPNAAWHEISFEDLDLLRPDLRRAKENVPAATPESIERGRAILAAAAEAAGGPAVNKLQNLELTSSGVISMQGMAAPIEAKTVVVYPDRLRNELTLANNKLQQVYDGKSGWMISPQGVADLPPTASAEFQRRIDLIEGVGVYRLALAGTLEAQALGEEEVKGKKELALQWKAPSGPVKLYVDPETHLLAGASYRSTGPSGSVETIETWDDFRLIEGVKLPFHTVTYHDEVKFREDTIKEIKVNTQVDPSLFTKTPPKKP